MLNELDVSRLTLQALVSRSTVQRVARGDRVSLYSLQRVLRAARELGIVLPESSRPSPRETRPENDESR